MHKTPTDLAYWMYNEMIYFCQRAEWLEHFMTLDHRHIREFGYMWLHYMNYLPTNEHRVVVYQILDMLSRHFFLSHNIHKRQRIS